MKECPLLVVFDIPDTDRESLPELCQLCNSPNGCIFEHGKVDPLIMRDLWERATLLHKLLWSYMDYMMRRCLIKEALRKKRESRKQNS